MKKQSTGRRTSATSANVIDMAAARARRGELGAVTAAATAEWGASVASPNVEAAREQLAEQMPSLADAIDFAERHGVSVEAIRAAVIKNADEHVATMTGVDWLRAFDLEQRLVDRKPRR